MVSTSFESIHFSHSLRYSRKPVMSHLNKGINFTELSVVWRCNEKAWMTWRCNQKAWMTSTIIQEWLLGLNFFGSTLFNLRKSMKLQCRRCHKGTCVFGLGVIATLALPTDRHDNNFRFCLITLRDPPTCARTRPGVRGITIMPDQKYSNKPS